MTALPLVWRRPNHPPALIDTLTARARQAAYLFRYGWLDLPAAVDRYQEYAERSGAVAELGADLVQAVAAAEFEKIPREPADLMDDDGLDGEGAAMWDTSASPGVAALRGQIGKGRPTPQVTIEAIVWCAHERGPEALNEPANIERLKRCDAAALVEVERRLTKILEIADDSRA